MKKCPYCRERRLIEWLEVRPEDSDSSEYVIQCLKCGTRGPVAKSRTEAKLLWNKRRN